VFSIINHYRKEILTWVLLLQEFLFKKNKLHSVLYYITKEYLFLNIRMMLYFF